MGHRHRGGQCNSCCCNPCCCNPCCKKVEYECCEPCNPCCNPCQPCCEGGGLGLGGLLGGNPIIILLILFFICGGFGDRC